MTKKRPVAGEQPKAVDADAIKRQAVEAVMRESQLKGQLMQASMDTQRSQKVLLVIGHITAGRTNEAIQEILTPMPMLFKVDVRFGDDQSRIAAEDELLQKVLKLVADHLQQIKITRQGEKA